MRLNPLAILVNTLLILLLTVSSLPAYAQIKGGIDLEAVMKQMRFEYTQALKTPSVAEFNQRLMKFKQQLSIAQKFPFSAQKRVKSTQGLDKVAAITAKLELPVTVDTIEEAKRQLYAIDDLRKKYHDKKPSLWERFYQMFFAADKESPPLILLDNS